MSAPTEPRPGGQGPSNDATPSLPDASLGGDTPRPEKLMYDMSSMTIVECAYMMFARLDVLCQKIKAILLPEGATSQAPFERGPPDSQLLQGIDLHFVSEDPVERAFDENVTIMIRQETARLVNIIDSAILFVDREATNLQYENIITLNCFVTEIMGMVQATNHKIVLISEMIGQNN